MALTSYRARMLDAFRRRIYVFFVIVAVAFLVVFIQLINLQFVQGEVYKLRSKINMEDYIPIPAPRGAMYDRNFFPDTKNTILVSNRPSFNISTIPARFISDGEQEATLMRLCDLLQIDYTYVKKDIESRNKWQRILIKEDVAFETIVKIASHSKQYPNIDWEDVPVRVYNYGALLSHVIGYIGIISSKEFQHLRQKGYKRYQKVGKSGLEKEYDELLRGVDGHVRRIVDVKNRTEGEEIGLEPVAGKNLVLTIDLKVQKAAYDALQDQTGTIIVMKPASGEVLALVSKPDFDANAIIAKNNAQTIIDLQHDKKKPFLNRAIQAKYPPASTFKLITAIAALEEEKWKPHWTNYCPGKFTLKGYIDKDFYCYAAHGRLDLYGAIAKSCSVSFSPLGYKTGPPPILKYARYFGLGEKTEIDIPGERAGFIPSKKWKRRVFGQPWFDGDTINLSIGQGFLAVTPIGIANFVSGLVNDGIMYRPHLIKEIRSQDNQRVIAQSKRKKLREIALNRETLETIKLGMRLSVVKGTSARLSYLKIPVAGKTGTAQTRSKRKDDSTQHAWFVGFAPYGAPSEDSIVIAVMVEYGIAGAATAVPAAEKVLYTLEKSGYFK